MAQAQELGAARAGARAAAVSRTAWLVSWPLLMGVTVYLVFFRMGSKLLQDGDTYWHIAAGQWILRHGAIPTADPFSHSMRGAPWTASEWLSQVILAVAHDSGGWPLVIAITALAFAATIALLTRALLRWLEPIHMLLFAVLAVLMTAGHALARPHMLAMPLLVLWTLELVRAREGGRAPRLWMLPLMTVWANLHGGFTLGIALAAAFALEAVLEARAQHRVAPAARAWGAFLALTVIASVVTPNGPHGLLFTWQVLAQDTYALDRIGEWRSANFHSLQPLEIWLLGGMAVMIHQGLRLPPMRLLLLLGLLHLALKHVRYVELLGLVAPLFLAGPLAAQWHARQAGRQQFDRADRFFRMLSDPAGYGAVLVGLALCVVPSLWSARSTAIELPEFVAPTQAVAAAHAAGLRERVLNTYDWGGYLIYMGIPSFIDGRSDMYRDAFMKEYVAALDLMTSDALPKLLDKYQIAWTLLKPDTPAIALLDRLPGWHRIYSDKTAVVHARMPEREIDPPPKNPSP